MDTQKMSQRQAAFRADFRTRIAPAYFGWAHVALIYALGFAAIWYCCFIDTFPKCRRYGDSFSYIPCR